MFIIIVSDDSKKYLVDAGQRRSCQRASPQGWTWVSFLTTIFRDEDERGGKCLKRTITKLCLLCFVTGLVIIL